jgi:hypothetical protein
MPQYLVAVYHPDDYDPSVETEATIEDIHALNRELIAAGTRKFACGLSPAGNAKSLRWQPGKVLVADGLYTETKELKPLISTRRWRGRARVPSPAVRRARCARLFSAPLRHKDPAKASKQRGHCGLGTRTVVTR